VVAIVWGRKLGEGGFGEVYEAQNVEAPGFPLVVKLGLPGKPESLRHEIGAAYGLAHQNICSYKDIGLDPQRGTFLVMQHGGTSLEQVLKDQGALSPDQAFEVAAQIAAGLDYAHSRGVIHHDIKPANVLIDVQHQPWEVRITDFGIAVKGRATTNTDGKNTVSATHPRGQSLAYSAPEQLRGDVSRWRSDQYSLALVVYSMLTGQVLKGHHPAKPFPMLSQAQNEALMKARDEDPDARFDSCTKFVAALRAPARRFFGLL
jgi:serine/threonine protein kinase